MARFKYAHAQLVKAGPDVAGCWEALRRAALSPAPDFKVRTAKVLLQEYDPKRFLLSHCTIIASVDSEELPGAVLGKQMVDGFQIDRRYPDYRITDSSSKYINNNNDAWERKLLLACFKTFIGAENYVEHIQIPELSKGKIIDAAARNIGDSIYVDILVATDRTNAPLVDAIQSGQLGTLSMGCSVEFTTCTKCGNVAADEVGLCPHIRYMKGNEFVDELGHKRKIAELCGHVLAEPGSVKFIEASWVANPAFTGAVIRNILTPQEAALLGNRIQVAFSQPSHLADPNMMLKVARAYGLEGAFNIAGHTAAQDQGQGQDKGKDEGGGGAEFPGAPGDSKKPEVDPLHKAVKDLADVITEKAVSQVRDSINKDDASHVGDPNQNDTLIKSAARFPQWKKIGRTVFKITGNASATKKILGGLILFKSGGWEAVRASGFKGHEILAISRVLDLMTKRSSMAGETRVYRTVLAVGGIAPYADVETYLAACRQVMGRAPTGTEAGALLQKGRLFSLGS